MGVGGALAGGVGQIAGGLNRTIGGIAQVGATTPRARAKLAAGFMEHACTLCPPISVPADMEPAEREAWALQQRDAHYARVARAAA